MSDALTAIGVLVTWTAILVWHGATRSKLLEFEVRTKLLSDEIEFLKLQLGFVKEQARANASDLRDRSQRLEVLEDVIIREDLDDD